MSKKILIVESDSAFSHKLKDELAKTGFEVLETTDGKGAYDLTRKEKPSLVVLAVELAAGQSGYLVCGKIKKDDDLKKTPVIIIGKDPEGFEGHKKLKTRAEEYLKKPFAPEALTVKVGVLIGLPESKAAEDEVLVDDEAIALVETGAEGTIKGDPDLDMLDDAFANLTPADDKPAGGDEPLLGITDTPADIVPDEPIAGADLNLGGDEDLALGKLGGDEPASLDIELEAAPAPEPFKASSPTKAARPASVIAAVDDAELKQLREKVRELEEKVSAVESQLAEKDAELAATKASAGGGKDSAALKENLLKRDKEILKLKQELNEKETELVDLREKEAGFEQQASSAAGEIAKRDAQVKALTQKADQLAADKRKADAAVNTAKDEARAAAANLAAAQSELEQANEKLGELTGQLDGLRSRSEELERAADEARRSAEGELASLRSDLESARQELEGLRSEHGSLKAETEQRVQAAEEEATRLRARISELEESNAKNEDRVVKAYQKIKGDEKLREKTRKAISVAMQLLDDSTGANVIDENLLNP
jgi:CheY-like chemotaxis protein